MVRVARTEEIESKVKERVQKLMAQANIGSRRASEELIRQGRVKVNGEVVEVGAKADPATDTIVVDGEALRLEAHPQVYIALHKPINVLSTTKSHKGDKRQTVYALLRADKNMFMIGRLDAESQGLMVLTNDGELTNRLTHPRYRHTKTYKVTVYGIPTQEVIEQWEQGVYLPEDGLTAPCSVRVTKASGGLAVLQIVMTEGKKRQIRRVASQLGFPVRHLIRTHIGQLGLGEMKAGEWRELSADEVQAMSTPDPILRTIRVKQKRKK